MHTGRPAIEGARRGDRVERLALGPSGYLIEQSGAYDRLGPASSLAQVVRERAHAVARAARVLAERATALAPDAAARAQSALLLLGHGPNSAEDYAAWMKNLRGVADTVKAATGFRSVLVELVQHAADEAPGH